MSTATTTRAKPIGTGHLHNALEDARDLATLQVFCRAIHCTPADISSDGIHVDMLHIFDFMRVRGYGVGAPTRPQAQMCKGATTWLVAITLPGNGPSVTLGFYVPNIS